MKLTCEINGRSVQLEVPSGRRLLDILREDLGLYGTKEGCGEGECGACTVLLDGRPVLACLIVAAQAHGRSVLTVEGLSGPRLHALQQAFIDAGAVQCGFCTPGLVMAACALLENHPQPTAQQVRAHLSGNLCRCTGYAQVVEAVLLAAERTRCP